MGLQQLPFVRPERNYAFYLAPRGSVGSEAIVYLPAYAAELRQTHERNGFRPLSQALGDFGASGENALRIVPPDDERILGMIRELKSRVKGEEKALDEQITRREVLLNGGGYMKMDERMLYMEQLHQLKERRAGLATAQPTFSEAKAYFLAEFKQRVGMNVPQEMRSVAARVSLEEEIDREFREVAAKAVEERASVGQASAKPD